MNKHVKLLVVSLAAFFFVLLGLLVYFFGFKKSTSVAPCPRCNVIMIDIDILRPDALPCYGYKRNTAPNICAFAQKSLMFTDNYAQGSWTLPSMFSTITSLYPIFHRVQKSYRDSLDPSVPTLAQQLNVSGYNTAYFGSIDPSVINDSNGGVKGYNQVRVANTKEWPALIRGLAKQGGPFFAHLYTPRLHLPYLLENESQVIEPALRPPGFPVTQKDFASPLGLYLYNHYDRVFTPEAISKRKDLFFPFDSSKIPAVLSYFWSLLQTEDPAMLINRGADTTLRSYIEEIKRNEPVTRPYVRLLYDSVLTLIDRDLEQLFLLLSSEELKKNTVVVLYSDHGEEFGERGRYGHPAISLYNEIIKTPLLIYVPGVIAQKIQGVTQNIDVFPSLFSILNLRSPEGLRGVSFFSADNKVVEHTNLVAISQSGSSRFSVYDGKWKLIVDNNPKATSSLELYNTTENPGETNNVASVRLDVVTRLARELSIRIGQ